MARGEDGANVPRLVGRELRLKNADATVQHQKMAEGRAMDPDNSLVFAIRDVVPCTAAGALGVDGANVPRRVGREDRLKNVDAIVLDQKMVEGRAMDRRSNPEYAIP